MRGRVSAAAGAGLAVLLLAGNAAAVRFDVPARLGDRQVRLTWMPEADDPLYTGNLEIFFEGRRSIGGGEIGQLAFDSFGSQLWAADRGGGLIARLAFAADTWQVAETLAPLPEGSLIVCLDLHPAGTLLAAGLAGGEVAVWRPQEGSGVEIFPAHAAGACRAIRFKPEAVAADSSFVTIGDDGEMIEWLRPGETRRSTRVPDALPTALGVLRDGRDESAVVGAADGRLHLYRLGNEVTPMYSVAAHPGRAVTQIIASKDARRLATADELGGVRVWNARTGARLGGYEPALPGPVSIAYSPRQSAYIAYATAAGEIGVLDGFVATRFNVVRNLGRRVTAFALSPDGLIGYFGGAGGELEWWHQGQCVPSADTPDCFGGYIVWRGLTTEPTDLVWMRTYQFGDTTWNWTVLDTVRVFVDPDSILPRGGDPDLQPAGPHNGVPHYYSLTKFRRLFSAGQEYVVLEGGAEARPEGFYRTDAEGEPTPLIPRVEARAARPLLERVFVAPDPYRENDPASHFSADGPGHVRFYHLPATATVRIYTAAGELVRRLEHRQTPGGEAGGSLAWDLKNEHRRDVVSGVYFYAVDTPTGETATGYLTILR
ncbi:MAG: WD40 repeat domain-containing protein [Candidatus Eisenbacteria bacterium]|uniref:WD40 repeat domain-containing protein n=1 Tax=Eiseniibacteriota bacterium TaxID=2212470 RepID=A0A937X9Q6_UNCEI|nr:WD40 repeat domain-containing protein [Candidatus Eisenbacteria bacterium]